MGTIWFCLVAVILAGYVVLDGFDIGAGILHHWIARTDAERRIVLRSIGSLWDGNEVWLLAGGGTLYFAFPALYAASFSGFYLPLMMVLWLLIVRGISIEFRNHVVGEIWAGFWDAGFAFASTLLAIFYGAALGNVVRGVPFDDTGHFFEPLWTNFSPHGQTGILDWYTVIIGVAALAALAMHGAAWVALRTEGALNQRATRGLKLLWWLVAPLTAVITAVTFELLPHLFWSFRLHPAGLVFPFIAIFGLGGVLIFALRGNEGAAFISSCAYLLGMLTSVAFSLYPAVLPSSLNSIYGGLTISNAKAADYGLKIGIIWWIFGMALATSYTIFNYRTAAGKIAPPAPDEEENY